MRMIRLAENRDRPSVMKGEGRAPEGKKVAIFTDHIGGVYVFTVRLSEELKKRYSHEVHIITYESSSPREETAVKKLAAASHAMHLIPRSKTDQEDIDSIHAVLRKGRFDLFVPNYRHAAYAAAAKMSLRTPTGVVAVCHDDDESYYGLLESYERIVDAFICPAPSMEERLGQRMAHRKPDIRCIPHGVPVPDTDMPHYGGGPIRCVYQGRLEEDQKSVSHLIGVAADLERRHIPFTLDLIGDGPEEQRYKRMVEDLGLSGRVEFHGYKEWPESVSLLRNAHLTVLASRHEGFCLGLAELMGMGLPAIAFSCGGVIEQYVKDGVNGYVVPWGSVSLMADAIAGFYGNPEKWKSFSTEAAKEIRTNYNMALFAARYAALIDETPLRDTKVRCWPRMRPLIAERNWGTRVVEKMGNCLSLW